MKKMIIFLLAVVAISVTVYSYGFDLNPKKKACKAACETAYDDCIQDAKDQFKKDKDKTKKIANFEACKVAKKKCIKECK